MSAQKNIMDKIEDEMHPATIDDIWYIDDIVSQIQDIIGP